MKLILTVFIILTICASVFQLYTIHTSFSVSLLFHRLILKPLRTRTMYCRIQYMNVYSSKMYLELSSELSLSFHSLPSMLYHCFGFFVVTWHSQVNPMLFCIFLWIVLCLKMSPGKFSSTVSLTIESPFMYIIWTRPDFLTVHFRSLAFLQYSIITFYCLTAMVPAS